MKEYSNARSDARRAASRAGDATEHVWDKAKAAGRDVKNTAKGEMSGLLDDIQALFKSQSDAFAKPEVAEARRKIEDRMSQMRDSLTDAQATAQDMAQRGLRGAEDYVNANPWQAVGIGAAVGLLVGILISRG